MNNIFITGEVGIGKSTIIEKVLNILNKERNLNIGGYKCSRNIIDEENKFIKSFFINPIGTSSYYKIIENTIINGQNKVNIFSESFNEYAPKLEEDLEKSDLITLDEIGFAETNSFKYLEVLNKVLDSEKIVFGVLKKQDCPVVNNILKRDDITLFTINEENRNYIYNEIYEVLQENTKGL